MPLAQFAGGRAAGFHGASVTAIAAQPDIAHQGWRVVAAAFLLAVVGGGLGMYGPAVYLHAVQESRGWPIMLVSLAITLHHLFGAITVLNLPRLYKALGATAVTRLGALMLALGLLGWAVAAAPWQLLFATVLTGCGWVTMGKAALNAIVSPWFAVDRPRALAVVFSGISIGGLIAVPLLAISIETLGFPLAAGVAGIAVSLLVWFLTASVLRLRPPGAEATRVMAPPCRLNLPEKRRFCFMAAAAGLAFFAESGLLVHLFSLIAPSLGTSRASFLVALAGASAVAGRLLLGWLITERANCRRLMTLLLGIQIAGLLVLLFFGLASAALVALGIVLFGVGMGGDVLPPRIAQMEFTGETAVRVAVFFVVISQLAYAFSPAGFGLIRAAAESHVFGVYAPGAELFTFAIAAKAIAAVVFFVIGPPRASRHG